MHLTTSDPARECPKSPKMSNRKRKRDTTKTTNAASKRPAVPGEDPPVCVLWNRRDCAPQVSLSADALTATGFKGHRMVRATHGVNVGNWYFELEILPSTSDKIGHCRVGFATRQGELQAPVGYDKHSYSYRDLSGSKVHQSYREDGYGGSFKAGDVVGAAIFIKDEDSDGMPILGQSRGTSREILGIYGDDADNISISTEAPSVSETDAKDDSDGLNSAPDDASDASRKGRSRPRRAKAAPKKPEVPEAAASKALPSAEHIMQLERLAKHPIHNVVNCVSIPEDSIARVSEIRFFLNGKDQGCAYSDIPPGMYFPAVSLFNGAVVQANFGPEWLCPPEPVLFNDGAADQPPRARQLQPLSDLCPLGRLGALEKHAQMIRQRREERSTTAPQIE